MRDAVRRDQVEVVLFDAALIFTGVLTLPLTHSAAGHVAASGGAWHALVQALLLFALRATARYIWRRYFRSTEK